VEHPLVLASGLRISGQRLERLNSNFFFAIPGLFPISARGSGNRPRGTQCRRLTTGPIRAGVFGWRQYRGRGRSGLVVMFGDLPGLEPLVDGGPLHVQDARGLADVAGGVAQNLDQIAAL